MILKMQYKSAPDGLGGNDDAGQMSAWYIFSSLGFYPVAPGTKEYSIGSPAVDGAVLNLENGKKFIIEVNGQGDKNVYIKKIVLNGKTLAGFTIKHADIMSGGKITFYMSDVPVK